METLSKTSSEEEFSDRHVLDQDHRGSLEKLEFKGIESRFSDVAYHFTSKDRLAGITQEGLRYADEIMKMDRGTIAVADQLLMEVKPLGIPVDLERVVFGQLEQRYLGTDAGPALRTNVKAGEALAIAVDPHDTYVGDARIREEMTSGRRFGTKWFDGDLSKLKAYYWENVMSMEVFKELYEPVLRELLVDGYDDVAWRLKDPVNEEQLGISDWVSYPELYIPLDAGEDAIPVERLAHMASSLIRSELERL